MEPNGITTCLHSPIVQQATMPHCRLHATSSDRWTTRRVPSATRNTHITTHAHELALTVLFESGLQHLADRPESFLAQPAPVQQFLSALPAAWDETLLLDGYPAHHVVMARRSGHTWYVAGINGTDDPLTLELPLTRLPRRLATATLMLDGTDTAQPWDIRHIAYKQMPQTVTLKPRGGFVAVIE